jgi:hypothetical protein
MQGVVGDLTAILRYQRALLGRPLFGMRWLTGRRLGRTRYGAGIENTDSSRGLIQASDWGF